MFTPDLHDVDDLDHNLATRNTVGDLLTRATWAFGERTAIVDGEHEITYQRLEEESNALAHALLDLGVPHQSPVTMMISNRWEFLSVFFGVVKAGLVAQPVNLMLTADDLSWVINDCEATCIVIERRLLPQLEKMLPDLPRVEQVLVLEGPGTEIERRPVHDLAELITRYPTDPPKLIIDDADLAECLYTSGTTSRPKGVLTRHSSVVIGVLSNIVMGGSEWGVEPTPTLNVLPLFHTTALNVAALPALMRGGRFVLAHPFEPKRFLQLREQHGTTKMLLLPMMWKALLAELRETGVVLDQVTRANYAMTPMSREVLDEMQKVMPNATIALGSGQTEVVPATCWQLPEHLHTAPESWGVQALTVQIAVLRPDLSVADPHEEGEIVYRSPQTTVGYLHNGAANAEAFAGGWFHSGDVGYLDSDGVLFFTDRLKDMIKTGGENVSSVEVERIVNAVPGVAECCVIGLPDDYWGEAVTAVVMPDGTVDPAELPEQVIATAKQRLAGFQVPKRVVVSEQLPRTATGKIRKSELRKDLR